MTKEEYMNQIKDHIDDMKDLLSKAAQLPEGMEGIEPLYVVPLGPTFKEWVFAHTHDKDSWIEKRREISDALGSHAWEISYIGGCGDSVDVVFRWPNDVELTVTFCGTPVPPELIPDTCTLKVEDKPTTLRRTNMVCEA